MMRKVNLQPAYILHTRAFRDTSLLVDAITRDHGRICLVVRGAKSSKSKFRGLLRPHIPLMISWYGKTDLYTLVQTEANGLGLFLQGKALLSAMYLNEIILKLLARDDPHPETFIAYHQVLIDLQDENFEAKLRYFELNLLHELGYGFDLTKDAFNQSILPDHLYHFDPERGIVPCQLTSSREKTFRGNHLLAFASGNLQNAEELLTAKQLMRLALGVHLHSELKTREVYSSL